MKIHPRHFKVQAATNEMRQWLLEWEARHELTDIEVLQALNEWQAATLKYMLRRERHGGDDKPADLEGE